MKKSECCKKIAAGLICACVLFRSVDVFAQIAASNPEGTKHNFKTFLNNVKNGVYLQKGMEYMGKGTAAIGDTLGTVSEYVNENGLKHLNTAREKYGKYKEGVEKFNEEREIYEEWSKKQYASAQKVVKDGMSAVDTVKSGVDTVKSTAEMAKSLPGSVNGLVDSAKGKVTGAVGSVTGEINGIADAVGVDASGVTNKMTGQGASGESSVAANGSVDISGGQSSSRQSFSNSATTKVQTQPSLTTSNTESMSTSSASSVSDVRSNIKNMAVAASGTKNVSATLASVKTEQVKDIVSQTSDVKAKKVDFSTAVKNNVLENEKQIDAQATISRKARLTKQSVENQKLQPTKKQLRRKTFKSLEKQSSLTTGDIIRIARINHSEPLAFALFGIGMPDGGTDQNGSVLAPPTIGLVKGLSSDDILKPGTMDKALMEMNDSLEGAQVGKEPVGAYLQQGKRELAAAYIAEAYKAQKEIEDFGEKVVNSLEIAPANNEIDQYSNINEANKAIVKAMNGFLQTKASRLMLENYENYIDFNFASPKQEDDMEEI